MVDAPPPTPVQYPSRRSLREQRERQHSPAPVPQEPSEVTSPALLSTPTRRSEHVATHTASVRVPALTHVPLVAIETETSEPKRRHPFIKVAAGGSVCALLLALSIPLTENANYNEPAAAAQQRLFSTAEAPEAMADSFSDIVAVETLDSSPTSFTFRPDALVNYPFVQTVMLTDPFGYRTAPVEQFHDAQDFAAAAGTQVQAIADGEVLEAGFANDGCGFGLKLEHNIDDKNVTSRYCHMQMGSHTLKVGDDVKMGDPVGRVGNTGMSFGPHLHLALVLDKKPIDPMPFLAKYSRMDRTRTNH
ncbi:M23 family metallopeptidase [Leucobacter viscericola]|uniref:M23 family metallopeptidase n=1 Tax=Leucobacter viscericola TaxID=2714935 RepID=A0A6G7XBN2_9MICO|nr:M23 family metallopeptidase [Leucobacter viscericola]